MEKLRKTYEFMRKKGKYKRKGHLGQYMSKIKFFQTDN